MSTTLAQLKEQVALRMDEITPAADIPSNISIDGNDLNPLDSLIGELVDDCVLELFVAAQYWRLPWTAFGETSVEIKSISSPTDRNIIRIKLPDDFLRIAEIDCSEFQRPITEVYLEQSEMGKRQHNRHLIAKEAKPVAVFSHGTWTESETLVTRREIDCYSMPSTVVSATVVASYIKKPAKITGSSTYVENTVPPSLIPALEWLIAARAFGARGDVEHANICQQNAQNLLV